MKPLTTVRPVRRLVVALLLSLALTPRARAAEPAPTEASTEAPTPGSQNLSSPQPRVQVNPVAQDEEIRARLQSVIEATGWFTAPTVRVEKGVVFLAGQAPTAELKRWAGELAGNTQDVVAVANKMEVLKQGAWDFSPVLAELDGLWRDFVHAIPLLAVALLVVAMSFGAGILATRGVRSLLRKRIRAPLLRSVIAHAVGALVVILGAYLVLRVAGLTQLAMTMVGGTGLIGLIVGIAFRDITENFLSSVFLSIQRPFETGDLVEISGVTGYVQQLNLRTTVLMTLDGNIVQIPNATVYKNNLRNFTTNANRREDFVVGIGYDDSINDAQEIARQVLETHPAVLNDPEPSVLADSMGASTINLRVYFWLDGSEHSWLKVRSSVIRMVKRAFQENGISMPDEAREIVFPQGVPVSMLEARHAPPAGAPSGLASLPSAASTDGRADASTKAEGGLTSDAGVIEKQALKAQPMKNQTDLLKAAVKE